MIEKRIDLFLKNKTSVHIRRMDDMFFNGTIISRENDNIIIINERKLGLKAIFVDEIEKLEEFTYKREGWENERTE